jgi:hypothetical protein
MAAVRENSDARATNRDAAKRAAANVTLVKALHATAGHAMKGLPVYGHSDHRWIRFAKPSMTIATAPSMPTKSPTHRWPYSPSTKTATARSVVKNCGPQCVGRLAEVAELDLVVVHQAKASLASKGSLRERANVSPDRAVRDRLRLAPKATAKEMTEVDSLRMDVAPMALAATSEETLTAPAATHRAEDSEEVAINHSAGLVLVAAPDSVVGRDSAALNPADRLAAKPHLTALLSEPSPSTKTATRNSTATSSKPLLRK